MIVFVCLSFHNLLPLVDSNVEITMSNNHFKVVPIGKVESPLKDKKSAPKQGNEGAPDAWLVFDPTVIEGLDGLQPGNQVIVLTWLDRAERDVLRVHPRDDLNNPQRGVFSTRSADRPNPIGLHAVEILSIDGGRVQVRNLEALNGTPILDVKPVLAHEAYSNSLSPTHKQSKR
jgi:tRNA-Thr(GGU) m(6)t(6)A37 methyltransferase TsaA